MRNSFMNRLVDLAATRSDIFLLCGDLGFSVLEPFAERFPDRFLNVGIAEQNMTQVAVGLAREGYNVFTYSIGNFPTLRCMEQIRYDVCYHKANVKIVAVGAGYAYGPQGVSHHTTEDLAMLRAIPDMLVCAPADPVEAKAAANFMAVHQGPAYVRLNKTGEPCIHDADRALRIAPGGFLEIKKGSGVAVLACGAVLGQVVEEVRAAQSGFGVYSVPFVGGFNLAELLNLLENYASFVTVEEHQLNGGFGAAVIEAVSDLYADGTIGRMPAIKRVAIPNRFIGFSGSQAYLRAAAGISIKNLLSV